MPIVTKTLDLDLDDETRAALEAGHGQAMLEAMARMAVNKLAAMEDAEAALAVMIAALKLDRLAIIAACEAIVDDCAEIEKRIDRMEGEHAQSKIQGK